MSCHNLQTWTHIVNYIQIKTRFFLTIGCHPICCCLFLGKQLRFSGHTIMFQLKNVRSEKQQVPRCSINFEKFGWIENFLWCSCTMYIHTKVISNILLHLLLNADWPRTVNRFPKWDGRFWFFSTAISNMSKCTVTSHIVFTFYFVGWVDPHSRSAITISTSHIWMIDTPW